MAIELPPWLTRQYDYASGIRQTGQQIAENLLRRKQLETQAVHAAAQAEQARALEGWRLAQAQALQDKTRMDQEREAKDTEALGKITTGLGELPPNAPYELKMNEVLKYGSGLHPERFKALISSLDRNAAATKRAESEDTTPQIVNLDGVDVMFQPGKGGAQFVKKDTKEAQKAKDIFGAKRAALINEHKAITSNPVLRLDTKAMGVELDKWQQKMDALIESYKAEDKEPESKTSTKRIRVKGPPGPDGKPQVGTVPEGTRLTEGWSIIE